MNHSRPYHNLAPRHGPRKFPAPLSGLLAALILLSVQAGLASADFNSTMGRVQAWLDSDFRFTDVGPVALSMTYDLGGATGFLLPGSRTQDIPPPASEPLKETLIRPLAEVGVATSKTALDLTETGTVVLERNEAALDRLSERSRLRLAEVGAGAKIAVDSVVVTGEQTHAKARDLIAAAVSSTEEEIIVPTRSWWQQVMGSFGFMTKLVRSGWSQSRSLIGDYWLMALANWQRFLRGEEPPVLAMNHPVPTQGISSSALERAKNEIREQVEASIRQDLQRSLERIGSAAGTGGPGSTLTVFPSTGSSTVDQSITTQVKNSFSDEVSVQFDNTGRSGVITPVFRTTTGSNYLFILTPLRK